MRGLELELGSISQLKLAAICLILQKFAKIFNFVVCVFVPSGASEASGARYTRKTNLPLLPFMLKNITISGAIPHSVGFTTGPIHAQNLHHTISHSVRFTTGPVHAQNLHHTLPHSVRFTTCPVHAQNLHQFD